MLPKQFAPLVSEHGVPRRIGEEDEAILRARHLHAFLHILQHLGLRFEFLLGLLALGDIEPPIDDSLNLLMRIEQDRA